MKQTMERNTFGLALPLRQAMEMKIVSEVSDKATECVRPPRAEPVYYSPYITP